MLIKAISMSLVFLSFLAIQARATSRPLYAQSVGLPVPPTHSSVSPATYRALSSSPQKSTSHQLQYNSSISDSKPFQVSTHTVRPFNRTILGTVVSSNSSPSHLPPQESPVQKGTATLAWSSRFDLSETGEEENLACGFGYLGLYARVRFAAVNQKIHRACGGCVAITCTDPGLCQRATTAVLPVVLVDDCGHCGEGDMMLNWLAFREATGLNQGSAPVDWFFVPCGPFMDRGGIRMNIMPGSNAYYQHLTFSNSADAIVNATINGQALAHADWQRWVWYNDGQPLNVSGSLDVGLQGSTGATRQAAVPLQNSTQYNLGVQF